MSIELVEGLARETGGTITEVGALPDGSGFAMMSMPLPADHWLTAEGTGLYGFNVPAMPFRTGNDEPVRVPEMTRKEFASHLREAGKYALRCSTFNGKDMDFDPDAVLQNLVVGLIGYWTETGLSSDDFANPEQPSAAKSLSAECARRFFGSDRLTRWFRALKFTLLQTK